MKTIKIMITLLLFFTSVFVHAATVAESQKRAAQTCFACHGETGKSLNNLWPNLAGQKKDYILKQLNDFRAGDRKNPLMSPMAQMLTEADLDAVASYFSGLN